MGYYTRDDIPFQFALAEAFTLCDAYHCSVMGPTWPNRMYWMTGTLDPEGRHGGPILNNKAPKGGYTWTTYAERLEKAGISWKVYQQEDNYGCNFSRPSKDFGKHPQARHSIPKEWRVIPEGQFEYDAVNDKLPAVSWVIPTAYQSEHPDYMPADGATFVASKIDAIAANPDVWAKTVFIINYDENDGIFDHVAPPVPAEERLSEFVQGLPIGGGFRVPCIIVSPWTAGGCVCSQPFDHTSVLQFLEKFTGIREPNISDWRRSTFGSLSAVLQFQNAGSPAPSLPDTSGPDFLARYQSTMLPKPVFPEQNQQLPEQEKRTRKSLSNPRN